MLERLSLEEIRQALESLRLDVEGSATRPSAQEISDRLRVLAQGIGDWVASGASLPATLAAGGQPIAIDRHGVVVTGAAQYVPSLSPAPSAATAIPDDDDRAPLPDA